MRKKSIHLATLRTVAQRMAIGPVLLRVWVVPLVSALLLVTRDPAHSRFGWLAVSIAIAFWTLDGHFSRQARLFQKSHARVEATPDAEVEMVLDTSPVDGPDASLSTMMFSGSSLGYYASVLAVISVVRALQHYG